MHVLGVGEGGSLAVAFGHHFPELIRTSISTVQKAGHFAFMDQPEKTAEMVRHFLLRYPIAEGLMPMPLRN